MNRKKDSPINLKGDDFTQIMMSVLGKGAMFRFEAKGSSMSPFIKHGDILVIAPPDYKTPETGDVVVFRNQWNKNAAVHRIVAKKDDEFIIKGDNLQNPDGVFKASDIIGIALYADRKGKEVYLKSRTIAFLSSFKAFNSLVLPFLRFLKKIVTV